MDAADLLDLRDPRVVDDPYPHLARLRSAAPLAWHSDLQVWVATGHAEVAAVLRDRRLGRVFADRRPESDWGTFNWLHADSILDSEPPKHTRLRRLVAGAFGRGHVQRLAPRIQALAVELLGRLPDGPFDAIADYAEPLPVLVIAELLGFPEADRHLLRPWSQAIVRMYEVDRTAEQEAHARAASAEFAAYVEDLATHRAARPGEDLLTDLVQARDGSDRLSTHELVATAVLLLNAGHEASVNGFGNGLHSWLRAQADQAAGTGTSEAGAGPGTGSPQGVRRPQEVDLDEPGAASRLVEEFLRHDSPLHLFERTAKEPAEVAGIRLAPGDKVAALLGAANRDPAVFTEPDRFDPHRDPNPHLAFGAGIHFCLGAPLARLELEISLRTLLERYPRLEVVEAVRRPTFVLRGFERLVVSPLV